MKRLSSFPCHTVTLDNGSENTNWRDMEEVTHASIYYAHPYHSWERGTNENTNGLLREYFTKKTDFTLGSDEEIAKVEYILNTRPRKRLGWSTPLQVIGVALHCWVQPQGALNIPKFVVVFRNICAQKNQPQLV